MADLHGNPDDGDDEDDEDYVPGAEEDVEEEFDEEDLSDDPDKPDASRTAGKKRKSAGTAGRRKGVGRTVPLPKRGRGGIALSDDEEDAVNGVARRSNPKDPPTGADVAVDDASEPIPGEPSTAVSAAPPKEEAPKPKSKVDDLWEEMKRGATTAPKPSAAATAKAAPLGAAAAPDAAAAAKAASLKALLQSLAPKSGAAAAAGSGGGGGGNVLAMFPQSVTRKETYTVREVAEFAGEKVTVEKTIEVGSEEDLRRQRAPRKTNLDSLLDRLGGKGGRQQLSAKAKTEHDWKSFKSREGLEDELAEYRKDGYVEKMTFLARSDSKQEELLREERRREREARRKQTGAGGAGGLL